MKIPKLVLGVLFLCISVLAQNNSKPSETIVRFEPHISDFEAELIIADSNMQIVKRIPELNMYVVKSVGISISTNVLSTKKEVLYTEKNGIIKAFATPNDKLFSKQWHHDSIRSKAAWNETTGSSEIVVAVSDTGISLKHEDLKNQIWVNRKEVAGNGVDDDNNGFIDDVNGWNFDKNSNNPDDDNDHGTHCAGIIGAEANNTVGGTGVAWNVKLMPVKFLDKDGSGDTAAGVKTILYAADNGAHIISASWGSSENSQALKDAIEYAGKKNVLFVAAAGNDRSDNDSTASYPANYDLDNLISVGASTSSTGKADFSNYGATRVHIAAPGENILSSIAGTSNYTELSGTSMATPVVSGVAALILSLDPNLNVKVLRNAILNAVSHVSSWKGKNATDGIIQADAALSQFRGGGQVWPHKIRLTPGSNHEMTAYRLAGVTWSVSNPQVASVTAAGVVQAVGVGSAEVIATNANGESVKAVVDVVAKSSGGGGCGKSSASLSNESTAGISFLMILPFLFAFGLRLRRRK